MTYVIEKSGSIWECIHSDHEHVGTGKDPETALRNFRTHLRVLDLEEFVSEPHTDDLWLVS